MMTDHTEIRKRLKDLKHFWLDIVKADIPTVVSYYISDITALLAEREWISVKDRLPTPGILVLAGCLEKTIFTPSIIYHYGFRWVTPYNITHWQSIIPPEASIKSKEAEESAFLEFAAHLCQLNKKG